MVRPGCLSFPSQEKKKKESSCHFYIWVTGASLARSEAPTFFMRDNRTNRLNKNINTEEKGKLNDTGPKGKNP